MPLFGKNSSQKAQYFFEGIIKTILKYLTIQDR